MSSTHVDVQSTNLQENHQTMAHNNQLKPIQCQRIFEGEPLDALEKIKEEMNVNITDKEKLTFFKIAALALSCRMSKFAQEAPIVGLLYLVKPSSHKIGSIIRKVIWSMLLLFGAGFMVFQIYDRISYYLTYPTIVNYRVAYNQSLRFPTVSICPEFRFSKKALAPFDLPEIKEFASMRFPPMFDIEFGEDQKISVLEKLNLDWELFYELLSIRKEDMLLECSFRNLPCDSNIIFKKISTHMGNCFSFNPVTANYVTTHPGASNGLRLVLWVNQSDCFLAVSPAVGFRAILHDPRDRPSVHDAGLRVGTGISTSVSFSLRNVSMLSTPYGDCHQAENYTFVKCMTICMALSVVSECNCTVLELDVPGKTCSPDQTYHCVTQTMKRFISSRESHKCDCPLHCNQVTYPYSVSTNSLSQLFINYTSQRSQFKGRNLTMSKLSKELVYLEIFYSQLSFVDVQTTPAYDFLTLICDIGGALGLILGGTILTIFEFLQCFIQIFQELITSARFAKMQLR